MSGRVLILGAAGRLGAAAATAFRAAGWTVASQVRPGATARAPRGTRVVEADALDRVALTGAAHTVDVVLHALNPTYTQWSNQALPLAYAAIEAAESAGATLIFPGNVYNYGASMPPALDEATAMQPTSQKGRLRLEIERRMQEAAERGMRTIILRAGDFFGGGRGSWLDLVIVKDIHRGRVTYPGPIDVVHEWAYLPDLTAALVRLADKREQLGQFAHFGFPGHAVTGRDFVAAIAKALGRGVQIKRMQWWLIHSLSPFVPLCRELSEMAYLWRVPHAINGDRLKAAIGDIPHTALDVAMARTLRDLGVVA